MRRFTYPMVLLGAAFVLAAGFVHLREWLDGYRSVPASVPGALVVRVGFPMNAALSLVLSCALVATTFVRRRIALLVTLAAVLLELGSLGALILSRIGSVWGWAEPVWTRGASQACAIEIGALLSLTAAAVLRRLSDGLSRAPTSALAQRNACPWGQSGHPDLFADLGAYIIQVLGDKEVANIEEHLSVCQQCRADVAELSELTSGTNCDPPPAVWNRIASQIGE